MNQFKKYLNIYSVSGGIIVILTLIECIKFLIPYYSYKRFVALIFLVLVGVFLYNNKFNFHTFKYTLKRNVTILTSSSYYFTLQKYIRAYRDLTVYISFIILSLILFVSLVFNTGNLFLYSIIVFYGIFFLGKILGFQFPKEIIKSQFSSHHAFRFFILTAILYYGFIILMTQSFGVSDTAKWYYVGAFVLGYLGIGVFLFFDMKGSQNTMRSGVQSFLRPYNVMMGVLVIALLSYLGFQNFSPRQNDETVDPVVVREPGVPGIISDEAYLERLNNPEAFITYTSVSELYDISPGLQLGSATDDVAELQEVLAILEYYQGDISGSFDEVTQEALINTLKTECDWPESTRGIFGPQAKECIDNLEIPDTRVSTSILPDLSAVISDEVTLEPIDEEPGENIEAITEEEIVDEAGVSEDVIEEEVITDSSILVTELYDITPGIALGSSGDDVVELQEVLQVLDYYDGEISGNFDENTQSALVNTLRGECAWPESTRGIFGPLAKACIDNLVIPIN